MRVGLGLCALLAMLVGVHLQGRQGLAMQALPDGSLLYPLSAGSDDAALVCAGLMGCGLTVAAVVLAGVWQRLAPLVWLAYGLNVAALAVVVALVSLDSSLLDAAWLGDAWPLVGVLLALTPLGVGLVRGLWALLLPGGAGHRR